jgi:hypothetical protein
MGKIEHFNIDGQLQCRKCFLYKDITSFYNDPKLLNRSGKGRECKSCQKLRKQKYWRLREEFNLDTQLRYLLYGCRQRALGHTNSTKYKGTSVNITFEDLLNLYYKQNGKCAISGIEMTYIIGGGYKYNNISIDRIDSNRGYDLDNIQLVCSQVNMMKGTLTYNELLFFCKNIINNE